MMNPVKRTSDSAHEHNRIVEGAVFEGSIQSPVDIRVDGFIKGNKVLSNFSVLNQEF